MAEIVALTTQLNFEGAAHLIGAFARIFASGADLEARELQLRALGLSLDSLVAVLRVERDGFDACQMDTGLPASGQFDFGALLTDFEHFAGLARTQRAAIMPDAT